MKTSRIGKLSRETGNVKEKLKEKTKKFPFFFFFFFLGTHLKRKNRINSEVIKYNTFVLQNSYSVLLQRNISS